MEQVFEAKKRVLKIKTGEGAEYKLSFPTVGQAKEFAKKMKASDEADSIDMVQDYLSELGLPKKVSNDMEPDDLAKISGILSGQQKKS